LRERRHLALTLVTLQMNLNEEEGIVRRPRVVGDFPEAHLAIGGEHNPFAAVGQRFVPCVAQIPAEAIVLWVGPLPAGNIDAPFHGRLLQRSHQVVLAFGHCLEQRGALLLG
jgi:hypothetical protein